MFTRTYHYVYLQATQQCFEHVPVMKPASKINTLKPILQPKTINFNYDLHKQHLQREEICHKNLNS